MVDLTQLKDEDVESIAKKMEKSPLGGIIEEYNVSSTSEKKMIEGIMPWVHDGFDEEYTRPQAEHNSPVSKTKLIEGITPWVHDGFNEEYTRPQPVQIQSAKAPVKTGQSVHTRE